MLNRKLSFSWVLLTFFYLGLSACDNSGDAASASDDPEPPKTIAETAAGDERFSTLVSLLQRVDLVGVLGDENATFTVFAPTNQAFTAAGIDASQLSDDQVKEVLLYHVLGGSAVAAGDLPEGQTYVSTAATTGPDDSALSLLVERSGSNVTLNNSVNVAIADLETSNGIIHAIDGVLLPLDVVGHAIANDNLSMLVSTLSDAPGDLVPLLQSEGPFTVFAPVNTAFENIKETVATLSGDQVATVLTYHVVGGANVPSSALSNGQMVATANAGQELTVNLSDDGVSIGDATEDRASVVIANIQATNGVIHVVNKVLIPGNL